MNVLDVEVTGLGKRFRRGAAARPRSLRTIDEWGRGEARWALRDVALEVANGETVGIIGPNGSGKSTLVKAVFGLATVFDGGIDFDGRSLAGVPAEAVSGYGLAYVPQTQNVFTSMTIRENLLLAVRRLGRAASQRALGEAFDLFPILRERQRQLAGQLSGGERQMLAIGRALMARPDMLILDEPSLGLAPLIVENTFRIIRQINAEGVTILIVEQNIHMALEIASYGYIIEAGVIVGEGTSADLLSDRRIQDAYLGI